MKIKISTLEPLLNYKIKRNVKCLGLDTAKRTGACFIHTTDTDVIFDWIFLEFNYENQEEMLKQMYREFDDLIDKEDIAIIEEVFVGFSRTGSMHLAKMGTLAVSVCIKKNIPFKLLLAKSARAKFFVLDSKKWKGKTKQAVAEYLKTLDIEVDDTDISDAVILALCGICEDLNFNPKSKQPKKKKVKKIKKVIKKKNKKRKS